MKKKSRCLIFALIGFVILAVIFIGVPLFVNTIIGTPTPKSFTLYGKSEGWHNFWAVYLGSIMGAVATFIILYITIQNNNIENQRDRDTQMKTIKYQTRIAWIDQLRDAISYAQENLTFEVQRSYSRRRLNNEASLNQLTEDLFENANKVKRKFVTVLYGSGEYETDFLSYVDLFCQRYICFLFDLEFLYSIDFSITSEFLQNKVEEYKRRDHSSFRHNKRIWFIIEERSYGTGSKDYTYYINEISKRYEFQDFESKCLELMQYELEEADKILNGPKQDK